MELRTVKLLLALGSFLFALLLIAFKYKKKNPQAVPFWISAKMLQAVGSFMLFLARGTSDSWAVLGNIALLLGCAYEAWTVLIISGQNIKREHHILTALCIIAICLATPFMVSPYQSGVIFLMQSIFYFLPSLFLFSRSELQFTSQMILAVSYCITGFVFLTAAVLSLGFPETALSIDRHPIAAAIPIVSFSIFLISGFILLMLAKERSDQQIQEMQESLKRSEFRFQQIVETAIEGIVIFDQEYKVVFVNRNMASMLGYAMEELIGRTYESFFPQRYMDVYKHQESLRRSGKDSVYECCLLRKDGTERWFLISAKAIFDDSGRFEGSFGMFTDINDRKEMELLLEETNRKLLELSNQDGLTGIANRRRFDAMLEHEYSRLRRSHSRLSIILFDIDHFKEYNDFYGHVAGDECLRQVGRILAGCIQRSVDVAARYGGDEFACILPDTDLAGALIVAERIRQRIHGLKIEHAKSPVSEYVTASLGVATVSYAPNRTIDDIISMADKLLYEAKVAGRNRIRYAGA